MTKRSLSVDILKTVGILCVILAHVNPPGWLYNIRVFDVCMLVFASGITLKYHGNSLKDYLTYLLKRFIRLIVPTWIFLIFYFGFSYMMSLVYQQWKYSISDYVKSFTFTGGIDYIWIIRVYFLMAILSPAIVRIGESNFFRRNWFLCFAGLLIVNQILGTLGVRLGNETFRKLFQGFAIYTLGYAIIEIAAGATRSVPSRKLLLFSAAAFFSIWAISGWVSPQTAKYPPQALYLLYGMMVSLAVYGWLEKGNTSMPPSVCRMIEWISKNSLNIYFWHILPVVYISKMGFGEISFLIKYFFVLMFACVFTAIQNILTKKVASLRGYLNNQ